MKNETDERGRVMPASAQSRGAGGRVALWTMRAVRVGLVATAVVASFGFVAFRVGEARAATLGIFLLDELSKIQFSRSRLRSVPRGQGLLAGLELLLPAARDCRMTVPP